MSVSPLERMKKILYKRLGTTKVGLMWVGILITAISAATDDSLSTADKVAQITMALFAAWALSVFTASLAGALSLASPWIIAFLGMIAAAIIGVALAVVAQQYFSSHILRKRVIYV